MSSDGGETWSRRSSGLTTNPQVQGTGYQDRVSFGRLHLAAGALREGDRTLFLEGYNGLFRSTDDGRRWHELETLSSSIVVGLAVSPNYASDGTLAVTTYINGAFLSDDRGATWRAINHGLEQPTMYSHAPDHFGRLFFVAFSPSYSTDHVMFSASPKRILLSANSGNRWREIRPAGSSLSEAKPRQYMVAVSPEYPSDRTVVVGESSGEVFRSDNGGSSFGRVGTVPHPIRSFAPSPMFGSDSTVFAGTGHGVFESVDRGVTWAPIGPDAHNVAVVAVSPGYGSDQTIFAGAGDGLFVTRDAGASWDNVGVAAFGPAASVQAVAVSPSFTRDGIVLASIQGRGLFRSTDGGTTFAPVGIALIEDNQLLNNFSKPTSVPVVFSPDFASDRTVFGFSGTEVFKSTDAGETWTNVELPRTLHDADTPGVYRHVPRRNLGEGRPRGAALRRD